MPSVHTVASSSVGNDHVKTEGDVQQHQQQRYHGRNEEQYVPLNDILGFQTSHHGHQDDSAAAGGDASSVGSAWAPLDSSSAQDGLEHEGDTSDGANYHHLRHHNHQEPSLQDRLVGAAAGAGTSALWGSLELLKMAGGLTLSTTGKLVAPPLKVTQQVLLPSLWAATVDYIKQVIPSRIQDWFKIFSASLYHLYVVLRNTKRGTAFRSRLATVGADLVDCVSSDESRQAIADSMASVVKLSEAMHTPEFKSFLDQLTVLGARLVDAAASGRNKQLLNDVKETVWSGVELMSDPSTILALAEVTATLCHTLEMEEALYRRTKHGPTSRRRQRLERNQFTQQAYAEPDLMKHYDATVEQVIISGLGVDTISDSRSGSGGGGPPKSVAFENSGQATFSVSAESISVEEQWKKAGRDKVDSNYLEQKIRSRSEQMEQERKQRSTMSKFSVVDVATVPQSQKQNDSEQLRAEIEDLPVESVAEDEDEISGKESQSALQRQSTVRIRNASTARAKQGVAILEDDDSANDHVVGDETPTLAQSSPLNEPDSAMSRFYRTLDDVLAKKRSETMEHLVEEDLLTARRPFSKKNNKGSDALHRAVTSMNVINSMTNGVSQKKDKDSLAQRLKKWRDAMQGSDSDSMQAILGTSRKSPNKNPVSLLILAAIASSFFLLWFGFGCFGMYVFVKARVGSRAVAPAIATVSQEIIIRIVKEVVHVNQNGAIHDGGLVETNVNPELFAQCVSAAIEHA